MQTMIFDENGRPVGVRNVKEGSIPKENLKTSDSLDFLKDDNDSKFEDIFAKNYWSLYEGNKPLSPLKFSNGKTQEDVVKEVVELSGKHKVIFLHGTCGSGKSAIALNVARILGKSSIVVPVKALQNQYEEDYITKKNIRKSDGKKMKIAMITGKANHDSLIQPGVSCADPFLPENIKITERNYDKLKEYASENPFVDNPHMSLKNIKRATVAASNPYWSPIVPEDYDLKSLKDATKKKYVGANGRNYVFYHRKKGCSYYDQYVSYFRADAIIFNSAKYLAELSIGRKPLTEVDIIDEADDFLDSFFKQAELNLTMLLASLKNIFPDSIKARESIEKIKRLIELEEKNKRLLGIKEDHVFHISETKLKDLLKEFLSNVDLESEITLDELSYSNKALEIAKNFENSLDDLYLTFKKDDDSNILARLVSTNLSGKFQDLLGKTKTLVLMSGTLHSESILKNIFGIKDYATVQAEELNFGSMETIKTGKEFDCKYANFFSKKYSRKDYLHSLRESIKHAKKPSLVHIHAFRDLPSERELGFYDLGDFMTSERIVDLQRKDKTGTAISDFKKGAFDTLFSTKCSRGVDFPGEVCNSIIFTKYPNPNVKGTFWKVLQKTNPNYYWEFYKDKAWREFLQRIYRALRSPTDHVQVLSPDSRVLDAVNRLQNNGY
jgi:Rad3-related DNA helicase